MSYTKAGRNRYGEATVWIKNGLNQDVSEATVYGDWSGIVNGSSSGDTGLDGKVKLTSPRSKTAGTFTFCVTDVVASGYVYDPAMNVETCDSIAVP